jgi:hypothetical protein
VSTHFLATPLGKKSLSAAMAGNKEVASKIDPKNIIDAEYDDVPEEHRKALEDQIKALEAEYKKQLDTCFRKTRQDVIEKEIRHADSLAANFVYHYIYIRKRIY